MLLTVQYLLIIFSNGIKEKLTNITLNFFIFKIHPCKT